MNAEVSRSILAHGITAITDLMGKIEPIDYLHMYNEAVKKGLMQRTVLYYLWENLKDQSRLDNNKTNPTNQVHIGGIKLFSDGSVSGKTALVKPPFLGEDESHGIQMTTKGGYFCY